jgi:hypothetical protein
MAFYKPNLIIIKSNYFQNAQKGECFLDDFEALVREIDVRALVLQKLLANHVREDRCSRTTMRRDIILKLASSKTNLGHLTK